MSLAWHCDGPGCDTWQRTDTDLPTAWLHVDEQGTERSFCLADCLLRFYAARSPVEVR